MAKGIPKELWRETFLEGRRQSKCKVVADLRTHSDSDWFGPAWCESGSVLSRFGSNQFWGGRFGHGSVQGRFGSGSVHRGVVRNQFGSGSVRFGLVLSKLVRGRFGSQAVRFNGSGSIRGLPVNAGSAGHFEEFHFP